MDDFLARNAFQWNGRPTLMVACTNAGYVPFLDNMVASMRRVLLTTTTTTTAASTTTTTAATLADRLVVFAMDDEAEARSARILPAERVFRFRDWPASAGPPPAAAMRWTVQGGGGWGAVTGAKLVIQAHILRRGYTLIFTDCDIVWQRDPLPYLAEYVSQRAEVVALFQSDETFNGRLRNLCTGFFVAFPPALPLFDPGEALGDAQFRNDQVFVNARIKERGWEDSRVQYLPALSFCNGNVWQFAKFNRARAFMAHFNYLVGPEQKQACMKRSGMWFLPSSVSK